MKTKFKDIYFLSHLIVLVLTFILLTISMFGVMLKVSNTVYSSYVTYVPQWSYQLQTSYEYQCQYVWGIYGSQYVCQYVPVTKYVPVMNYVPQWNYYTTIFTKDVHLYDILLSSFNGNAAKITCISILLFALISTSIFIHFKNSILRQVGHASYNVLTVLLTGSIIGVIRLLVNNSKATKISTSFYLIILASLLLIGFSIYSFIKFYLNNKNKDKRLNGLFRYVALILLLILSETTITNLYGFFTMILLVIGIIISANRSLVCKITGTVFSSGLFLYSFITMIVALAQGLKKSSFFKIIPVDSLIYRILTLVIFVIMVFLFVNEIKKKNKIKI